MILPSKHISEDQAVLGVGAIVLRYLDRPQTVSGLWSSVRHERAIGTFERFVIALDLLYVLGLVGLSEGLISRISP